MPATRSRAIALLLALGLLAACQASATPDANPPLAESPSGAAVAPAITARVVTAQPPGSLDPARVSPSDVAGSDLVESLYVGLTRLDPDTNSVTPALASDWNVSPDELTWTFTLRGDVNWVAFDPATSAVNVLRPVSADDVVYAVWRACHPATDAPYARTLFVIRGCRQINDGDPALVDEQALAAAIGVRADSPTSVSFELEQKTAHFLSLTATPIMRPVAREAFAEQGATWRDSALNAASGPWVIASHTPGQAMTLAANLQWPFARAGNLTAVELQFAPDAASAYAYVQAGQADVSPVPPDQMAAANLMRVEPRVTFLVFAADQFPTDDVLVRRGLAAAIDRERLVSQTLAGNGLVTAGIVPPGSVAAPAHGDSPAPPFDLDYARNQMEAAGYPNCQLFPRLTVAIDRSPQSAALADALVRMWQDNLGCNDTRFDVQRMDMRLLLEQVNTPLAADWQTRPHISLMTWQADYPDADNWLGDLLHCQRGYLQVGRPCDVADDLVERAASERNPDARAALYAEAEGLFFGADGLQPIAPLYTAAEPLAAQPSLQVTSTSGPLVTGPMRYERWQLSQPASP